MRKIPEVRSSLNCSSDTSHVKLYRLCSHYLFVYCYDNLTTLWLNFHLPTIILSKKVSIYFSLCFIPKKDVASLSHGFSHEFSHGFSVHLRSTTFRERWKGAALWGAETADSGALPRSPDALLSNYTYIYIYISISLYLYIYVYSYIYISIPISVCLHLHIYLYICISMSMSILISISRLYIPISIYRYLYAYRSTSIGLSLNLYI